MVPQHRRRKGATAVRRTVSIDPALDERLSAIARARGISLNLAVDCALRAGLPHLEQRSEVLP